MSEIDSQNQSLDFCLLVTTLPDAASAEALARHLLGRRLVACVNCVPGLTSFYRWQGEIQAGAEVLLLMKTRLTLAQDATAAIEAAHPYELPEVLTVPLTGGSPAYLDWLWRETGQEPHD